MLNILSTSLAASHFIFQKHTGVKDNSQKHFALMGGVRSTQLGRTADNNNNKKNNPEKSSSLNDNHCQTKIIVCVKAWHFCEASIPQIRHLFRSRPLLIFLVTKHRRSQTRCKFPWFGQSKHDIDTPFFLNFLSILVRQLSRMAMVLENLPVYIT